MQSFKEYLIENEFMVSHYHNRGYDSYRHVSNIHNNQVQVDFDHDDDFGDGHYSVHFKVNDTINHTSRKTKSVLHHVAKVIHKFIQHKQPAGLHFSSVDDDIPSAYRKQHIFNRIAHKISKNYGANVETSDIHASIYFNK